MWLHGKEAVTDGQVHAEVIRKLNEIYPAAACTVIMDLTVGSRGFWSEGCFEDNEVPNVVGRLVTDVASVKRDYKYLR